MALLSFPSPATNGQLYPTAPLPGQNQYQYEGATQTWRLLGTATTVTPGCYGDSSNVATFCVDAQGRITTAANVPIASSAGGTVTDVTAGTGLTGGTITGSGTIALDTTYTDGRYVQASSLPLPINQGGTGQVTRSAALNALLPSQLGQGGNFLYTDGTNASWLNAALVLVSQAATPPLAWNSPGSQGQVASDLAYFYYHDGTNWNRVAWDPTPW